jgi:hypothetical protein
MPKLPDMSQAAVRRREALTVSMAKDAAKTGKTQAKESPAPKRRAKRA